MTIGREHEAVLASLFDLPIAVACSDAAAAVTGQELPNEPWFAQAAPLRRREFVAGRACASRVLDALGVPLQPIARGSEGEPIWPSGVVGSISHSSGLCAAVGARASQVGALGLDVELDRVATAAFARRICSDAELRQLGASAEALAPVVFSVKEACYKLQFPLTRDAGAWARIEVLLSDGTFTARFDRADGKLASGVVRGKWRRALDFIWAGAVLP